MAFDNNFIEELKMNINIVDVVGREVNLKKAGSNYKGLCPFHSEKTPSFMVNEEKQIFNCFGCGEKGDAIAFVQKYYKLPFMDACEQLCAEYGIKMPEKTQRGPKIDYDKYYDINAKAARFFFDNLIKNKNIGYSYFKSRKINDDIIKKFGLGYAPDKGDALCKYLVEQGCAEEDLIKLGLARSGKNGIYDYFRNRVMFPIINTNKKVIGFGGRAIGDVKPKYLNSAESDVFLKKNNLYGLNLAKEEIASIDKVICVEGYMDVISLYQSGICNVVASLGTALTDNQAKLLTRYTKNVVLSYDSDNAGISAALRGIDVINNAGGKPKVLRITDGKDPDEFIKAHGRDEFDNLVNQAIYSTDFKLELLKKDYNLNNDIEVLEYIRKCVPILKDLSPVEQDIYYRKLSEEFGISEHAIAMEVQTEGPNNEHRYATHSINKNVPIDRNIKLEMSLLILSMNNTDYIKRIEEDGILIESSLGQKILSVEKLLSSEEDDKLHRIDAKMIYAKLDPEEESYFRKCIDITKLGPDDEAFYEECRSSYMNRYYIEKRLEIQNNLAVAEKMGNTDEVKQYVTELMEINNLINK